MKKTVLIVILLCFFFPAVAKAACTTDEKIALSKIVNNVKVTPVFYEEAEKYALIVSNITPDIYFQDINTKIVYKNTGKEITIHNVNPNQSYRIKFYSAMNNCYGSALQSIYITLPGYNKYYKDPLCEGFSSYKICQKWVNYNYDKETFEKEVSKLEKRDIIKVKKDPGIETVKGIYDYLGELYEKYYYIILPIIIVGCLIMITRLRKKEYFF